MLKDPRPLAQKYAITCFLIMEFRPAGDSLDLISPYLQDLEAVARDHTNSNRALSLAVMSMTQPKVSERTLQFMAAELKDIHNNIDEIGVIISTLLQARRIGLTEQVIKFSKASQSQEVQEVVLRQLGMISTKDPIALAFILARLENRESGLHRTAIEAISRLPPSEKEFFPPGPADCYK